MIVALRAMEPARARGRPPQVDRRARGRPRRRSATCSPTPALAIPLAMMAVVGTLGFNFQVILPLLGAIQLRRRGRRLHGARGRDGGRLGGRRARGRRARPGRARGCWSAPPLGFGVLGAARRGRAHLPLEIVALVPLGAASVTFAAGINSSLQLAAEPAMRGRVMALYSIVFLGSTPIGGPITGWLSQSIDPRAGLVLAGSGRADGRARCEDRAGARAGAAAGFGQPKAGEPRCEVVRTRRSAGAAGDGRRACDRGRAPVSEPA